MTSKRPFYMKMSSVSYFTSSFILSFTYLAVESKIVNETGVCVKKELLNIPTAASISQDCDFQAFVINSNLWADKSTLVTALTEGHDVVRIITCPNKWGKTLNLSMLKYFFGIEVDKMGNIRPPEDTWAYNYFKQGKIYSEDGIIYELQKAPLISSYDIIIKNHLCRYPIIYLNIGGIKADNIPEYYELREQIAENYEKYSYIRTNWTNIIGNHKLPSNLREVAKKELEKFDKISNKTENVEELKSSVRWLSKLLHQYHRTKTIILMDDWDGIVRNLSTINFRKAFKGEVEYFYREFMTQTFNENDHLQWAVITGVARISEVTSGLNESTPDYNFIDCPSPFPWYGFTFMEFAQLMDAAAIPEPLQNDSARYYDGYRYLEVLTNPMLCPFSISRFVSTREIAEYWKLTDNAKALFRLLRYEEYRRRFSVAHLCYNERTIIEYGGMWKIKYDDAEDLNHLVKNPQDAAANYYHKAFGFLMMLGHFSLHIKGNWYTIKPVRFDLQYMQIQIPNKELRSQICDPALLINASHIHPILRDEDVY